MRPILFFLLVVDAEAAVVAAPDPSNPDLYAAIERFRVWADYLFGPIGDFVLGVAFLIALAAWVVMPRAFVAVVQRLLYFLMIATLPAVVPLLTAIAS